MRSIRNKYFLFTVFSLFCFFLFTDLSGQIPTGYYNSTNGLTGTALQQALHDIIDNHTVVSYSSLWTWFKQTDKKSNGKVWDMYSDMPGGTPPYEYTFVTNQCGSYNSEGDCYNREHSWPSSWFNDQSPMYSDIFHLVPTDGYVNNQRGNYPFGEVGTANWTSMNGSRRGNCVSPGYTGTVFEPRDDFKGDFARAYFYMETRYYTEDNGWPGSPMASGSQLLPWAQTAMLLWHLQDPVSAKEIARNDSIYKNVQHNRNPFIDHPEYAGQIWAQYMPQPATYTWNVVSGNWSAPASWTPARTVALDGDILIFDGATRPTATVTIDFTAVQKPARLRIIHNAQVSFSGNTASREIVVGVAGAVSPQFEVEAGSTLSVSGSNPLGITLPTGYNASIAGTLQFLNGAHQLTGAASGSVSFTGSAVFIAGTGFSGSAFGTTSLNSVVFGSGTTYQSESGLPPFGAVAPSSVVVFQTGSTYKHKTNSSPSMPGRTYSHFILDAPGFNQTISSGNSPLVTDNFIVLNSLLFGLDFPGGVTIKGNLQVDSGTLRFNPVSGILKFDGAGSQTIAGPGALTIGTGCDVVVGAGSSTILNRNLTTGKDIQVMNGGSFLVSPGKVLTIEGSLGL